MRKIVAANWKMNGTYELATTMTSALKLQSYALDIKIILCPAFTLLAFFAAKLKHNHDIALGAQDVSTQAFGAYTGEVSAKMLKEVGCKYVIIGHSERRRHHQETDEIIFEKMKQATENGLIPIVCVGESLEERQGELTEQVLASQLEMILKHYNENFILAYEPVWAIGTGLAATPKEIEQTHGFLRKKLYNCSTVPILYGGSVNAANAAAILATADVDGVLVGGASLKVDEMIEICKAAHACS